MKNAYSQGREGFSDLSATLKSLCERHRQRCGGRLGGGIGLRLRFPADV